MPALDLVIKFKRDLSLVLSPLEVIAQHFFGIKIQNQYGTAMNEEDLWSLIKAAQTDVERTLNIKLTPQEFTESTSYYVSDFKAWGYIPTSYQVKKPVTVMGFFNSVKQIDYPTEWLTSKKSSDNTYNRNIFLVPTGSLAAPASQNIIYAGITPHLNFLGQPNIPYYWEITYETGFEEVPADIVKCVGMWASLLIFAQMGDIILGPGIASTSLGVDGLSQSIQTTNSSSSSGYSARIKSYVEYLDKAMLRLKANYDGITFTVV